ncbi:tripartite tricarboxylate transporter TctB family protein [Mangrovicella endophytica]|uniref:tripartite tricarboxylate transporter TctB family protein n=1 Tax=Mangrovicella endophytica TaxID=2066697 RepID=UPI000C9E6A27|nr:tripartite tricarboxylate transporter TctB family protein [Mangrovicella endophytica]
MNAASQPLTLPGEPDAEEGASTLAPAPTLIFRRDWGDLLVGAAILAVAAWFFVSAGSLEDYSGEGIGAADFPRGIAALLALGIAVIGVGALRRLAAGTAHHLVEIRRYGHVAIGMLLLLVFPWLMTAFGYYVAMGVWLAAFLVLCGIRHPLHVAAYVAGFLLFTKLVFEMILGTPLP